MLCLILQQVLALGLCAHKLRFEHLGPHLVLQGAQIFQIVQVGEVFPIKRMLRCL